MSIPARSRYGLQPTDEILMVESINGSPVHQVRITEAGPEYRYLTPDGEEYREGGSDWHLYSVDEMHRQVELGTPLKDYLQRHIDWSVTTFDGAPRREETGGG
jgi:hypothetical protein